MVPLLIKMQKKTRKSKEIFELEAITGDDAMIKTVAGFDVFDVPYSARHRISNKLVQTGSSKDCACAN